MIDRLLIIPARGGSKRIKLKNIKLFKGKPIISYPLRESLKSKLFKKIHVSTDDERVKKVVEKIKKGVSHHRPKFLSTDNVPLLEVFEYIVKLHSKQKKYFDEIWFLNPCSPLIKSKDLINASLLFKKQKNNSLLSVCKYSPPIQWAFSLSNNTLKPLDIKNQKKKSQSFEDYYYDTGNFGVFSSKIFYNKKKIIFSGYILDRLKAVDIDTMEDWNLALKLFK